MLNGAEITGVRQEPPRSFTDVFGQDTAFHVSDRVDANEGSVLPACDAVSLNDSLPDVSEEGDVLIFGDPVPGPQTFEGEASNHPSKRP